VLAEPRPGFDRWVSFRGQGEYNDPTINFDGKRRKLKGYVTDILTEEALRFINENAGGPSGCGGSAIPGTAWTACTTTA
jgi:hypothetical protein